MEPVTSNTGADLHEQKIEETNNAVDKIKQAYTPIDKPDQTYTPIVYEDDSDYCYADV